MARQFDDAALEYLELNSAPITAAPFTMSCWFNSDDITVSQILMFIGDKDVSDEYWVLLAGGAIGGDPLVFQAEATAGIGPSVTSNAYSANTWHHALAVEIGAASRRVILDGDTGSAGVNVTNLSPADADRISIARRGSTDLDGYVSGKVAEAAIWNVALSDAEGALLAQGFSPLFVRPHNLVAYWPLIRDDDNDWIGDFNLVDFNTPTVADHPIQIIYPSHILTI